MNGLFASDSRGRRHRSRWLPAPFAVAVSVAVGSPPAAAQGPLDRLGGQNDAQRDMARSIDKVCPALVAMEDDLSGAAEQLKNICRAMVQTANGILGTGSDEFSLDLDQDQVNDALQSINGEELQNPQQQITEIRDTMISSLTARIDAIRTGTVGPGISLAGFGVSDGERLLAADDLDPVVIPAQWTEDSVLGRLGVFTTGKVIVGDKDRTDQSDGYDFHTLGVTIGADYRITDAFVLGGAFGYSRYDADFDDTPRSPKGQDVDSNTYAGSLFATYYTDFGLFADAIGTLGWGDFDSKRKIFIPNNTDDIDLGAGPGNDLDVTAKGDFDSFQYGLAARVGYDYSPEDHRQLTITPLAGIQYLHANIDGFDEEGAGGLNLTYDDFDAKSLTSTLGVEATYAFSTEIGVVTPSLRADWVHEFADNDGPEVAYLSDPTGLSAFEITPDATDSNYGVLGAGVAAQLAGGWSVFADYATPVGLDDFHVHQINFGLRKDL